MKKILIFLTFISLLVGVESFAALPATVVWEVRQGATAGSVNGGGFDYADACVGATCTNYSLQDAAEDTGIDLASADGDVDGCVITSATHNFVAADVANIIHITAGTGWTAGWYKIVSTNANAATLDRACGTDGAKTGGTWYLGGAISLASTLDDDFFEAVTDGSVIYVKYDADTITLGEAVAISNAGTAAAVSRIIGYDTTRTVTNADANRQTIALGANSFTLAAFWNVSNLIFTGSGSRVLYGGTGQNNFHNVKASNTSTGTAITASSGSAVTSCELTSAEGVALLISASRAVGNFIYGTASSTSGVQISGVSTSIINNIITGFPTTGILIDATRDWQLIVGNTLWGAESPAGIGIDGNDSENNVIVNNIIYGFATGILFDAETYTNHFVANNLYNNTTPRSGASAGVGDLAVDPAFVHADDDSTANFKAGASVGAKGIPGLFPGSTTTSYTNIGAVQNAASSGGGSAYAD